MSNIIYIVLSLFIQLLSVAISFLGVVASLLTSIVAILIAIFGKSIENYINRPRVNISLLSSSGELAINNQNEYSWFFHILVKNTGRRVANNSLLMLKRVEYYSTDGEIKKWDRSQIPLNWKYEQELYSKNIGVRNEEYVDLFEVKEKAVNICARYLPLNFPLKMQEDKDELKEFECVFYLKYDEGKSNDLKIRFHWDGQWSLNKEEIQKHLQVSSAI